MRMTLTDMRGELLMVFNGVYDAGSHARAFSTASLPRGLYLAWLETDRAVAVERVMLAR